MGTMLLDWPLFISECVVIGSVAGLIYGVFGGGSGLALVPGFYYLLRHFTLIDVFQMQVAIASCGATAMLLGISAVYLHWRQGNIRVDLIKRMLPGLFIGSVVAIALLNVMASSVVKHIFSVVVILLGVWFWQYQQETDRAKWSLLSAYHHFLTFLQGLLWFLMGIPVFTVPYLSKCDVPLRAAIGCGAFFGVSLSITGALMFIVTGWTRFEHVPGQLGFINLYLVSFTVLPSAIMAGLGVKLGGAIPQMHLQKLYAGLVLIVGVVMLF